MGTDSTDLRRGRNVPHKFPSVLWTGNALRRHWTQNSARQWILVRLSYKILIQKNWNWWTERFSSTGPQFKTSETQVQIYGITTVGETFDAISQMVGARPAVLLDFSPKVTRVCSSLVFWSRHTSWCFPRGLTFIARIYPIPNKLGGY